jgi:hypothetical protein
MKVSTATLAKINTMDASNFTYKVKSGTKCIVFTKMLPQVELRVSIHGENKMIQLDHKARHALKQCTPSEQKKIETKLEEIKTIALNKIKTSREFKAEVKYIDICLDTKEKKGKLVVKAVGSLHGKTGFVKLTRRRHKEIKIESDLSKKDELYKKLVKFAKKKGPCQD